MRVAGRAAILAFLAVVAVVATPAAVAALETTPASSTAVPGPSPTGGGGRAGGDCNPGIDPSCGVTVGQPGRSRPPGRGGAPGRGGSSGNGMCMLRGETFPCNDPVFGYFNSNDGCFYKLMSPQPPPTDPLWEGHYPQGAIYMSTCPGVIGTGGVAGWFATPPPGSPVVITALQLAQDAAKRVKIPSPDVRRSPLQSNSDNGTPFTWVNLWTWFWTSPATWQPRSATASAGGLSATVTVTPTVLKVTPGDGGASVTCNGPGRAWTLADGNNAPSGGGCGYMYRRVAASPLTATLTIEWTATWTATDGEGGTLPNIETSATASFLVEQIQVVNR